MKLDIGFLLYLLQSNYYGFERNKGTKGGTKIFSSTV